MTSIVSPSKEGSIETPGLTDVVALARRLVDLDPLLIAAKHRHGLRLELT